MQNLLHFLVLFLVPISAISQGLAENYNYYEKLYGHFPENDRRALLTLNQSIKAAKIQKDYRHLTYVYEDAVYYIGDRDAKLQYADSSLVAAKLTKDQSLLAKAYLGKGIVYYYNFRDYAKALDEYRNAHSAAQKSKDHYLKYKIQFHIGMVKKYLGFNKEADLHFAQCVQYFKEKLKCNTLHKNERYNITKGYLNSLIQQSRVNQNLKKYSASSELISEGLHYLQNLDGFTEERGKFMLSLGIDKLSLKDFDNSHSALSKALLILSHEEDFTSLALTHFYLGKVSLLRKDEGNASRHFLQVDSLFSKHGFYEPELHFNYRYLIKNSKSKKDIEQMDYFSDQLEKLVSIHKKEAAYLATTVLREFDPAPETIRTQDSTISVKDLAMQLVIIILIGGTIFLLLYFHSKNSYLKRKRKVLFRRVMRSANSSYKSFNSDHIGSAIAVLDNFEKDLGFTQKGIKLEDVAAQLELSSRLISYVINTTKKENFNSYINRLRVEYAAKQISETSILMKLSVQGVAEHVGFSNRQTFSRIFHDLFGMTPKEYFEQNKEEREGNKS